MANSIYPQWKQDLLNGTGLSLSNNVKIVFVNTNIYTYSELHRYMSSVVGSIVGEPRELVNKTFSNGIFDADDIIWESITGTSAGAIIMYIDTGNVNNSPLVAYLDTGFSNLPLNPDGSPVTIFWNPSGIFKL